jgi:hypothetical protein
MARCKAMLFIFEIYVHVMGTGNTPNHPPFEHDDDDDDIHVIFRNLRFQDNLSKLLSQ